VFVEGGEHRGHTPPPNATAGRNKAAMVCRLRDFRHENLLCRGRRRAGIGIFVAFAGRPLECFAGHKRPVSGRSV
jgi:hypothetical protein